MERAGIITLYYENYNFGGLLQAYALPIVLKDQFKLDAEQIRYVLFGENKESSTDRNLHFKLYDFIYRTGIRFISQITEKKMNIRKRAFKQFMDEIPHGEEIYDYDSIGKCAKKYQVFLCGGDQIWNAGNGIQNLNVFTLKFASENTRKIAYAPSMAVFEMDDDSKKCMEQGIVGLKAVSVREKRSLDILKTVTDRQIEVVVDPVLLLTEDEWNQVSIQPKIKDKYILCYLLGDSVTQRKAVQIFSSKAKCKIVTFPHIHCNVVRKCDLFFGDIHDYTSGPREFIGLIKNAEFVITDSFHACVFSMIFKTPFAVFERNKIGEKGNMNSRIYDFLEEYHLERQLVTEKDLEDMRDIPKVDFSYAHEHWKMRREESLEYLKNALKDN